MAHDKIIFLRRPDALTLDRANYYQTLLYRTVKVGTEIEFAFPKGAVRETFQPMIEEKMQPSRDMNRLGNLGVFNVVKEHCGIEIQVIGRHPQWEALLAQYQKIIRILWDSGARIRPTCGLHYHLLSIGLSESIPEIILANIWNICRRFALGLKFMSSAGDHPHALCRRRQNNAQYEFMRQSPLQQDMRAIQANLKASLDVPEHQNFVNLEHVRFDVSGDVEDLHIEFRFPDAHLSPAAVTATTFLFLAILLKAVEISKFGLLHVGDIHSWTHKKTLLDQLSNNDGALACSDTSGITPEKADVCRQDALDLLKFLKSVFVLLDNPAEGILMQLARQPISFRKCNGLDWQAIENDLLGGITPARDYDEFDYRLFKIVELGTIENAPDPAAWYKQASLICNIPIPQVQARMESYHTRKPVWDNATGRMLFLK